MCRTNQNIAIYKQRTWDNNKHKEDRNRYRTIYNYTTFPRSCFFETSFDHVLVLWTEPSLQARRILYLLAHSHLCSVTISLSRASSTSSSGLARTHPFVGSTTSPSIRWCSRWCSRGSSRCSSSSSCPPSMLTIT